MDAETTADALVLLDLSILPSLTTEYAHLSATLAGLPDRARLITAVTTGLAEDPRSLPALVADPEVQALRSSLVESLQAALARTAQRVSGNEGRLLAGLPSGVQITTTNQYQDARLKNKLTITGSQSGVTGLVLTMENSTSLAFTNKQTTVFESGGDWSPPTDPFLFAHDSLQMLSGLTTNQTHTSSLHFNNFPAKVATVGKFAYENITLLLGTVGAVVDIGQVLREDYDDLANSTSMSAATSAMDQAKGVQDAIKVGTSLANVITDKDVMNALKVSASSQKYLKLLGGLVFYGDWAKRLWDANNIVGDWIVAQSEENLGHFPEWRITVSTQQEPPAAPATPNAVALSSSSIRITWADVSSEDGYVIIRAAAGTDWTDVGRVGPNVTSFTDTGLAPSTGYWYVVGAYNSAGTGVQYENQAYTMTLAASVTLPAAPTVLTFGSEDIAGRPPHCESRSRRNPILPRRACRQPVLRRHRRHVSSRTDRRLHRCRRPRVPS
jgi:hypothetical protein